MTTPDATPTLARAALDPDVVASIIERRNPGALNSTFFAICPVCGPSMTLATLRPTSQSITLSLGPRSHWSVRENVVRVTCEACGAAVRIDQPKEDQHGK